MVTALVSHRPATLVRVYAGRWIIDCPACPGAQIPQLGATCVDCGVEFDPVWPTDEIRHGVERLLGMRPLAYTRNWVPGETLHDLLAENVEHGIGPTEPGGVIEIIGDTITRDTLAAPARRLAIGA